MPRRRSVRGSSRLGELGLGFGEGPVEPRRQRFDIVSLDGRAAPDAQARRRIAIGTDVVGDAFLFEQRRSLWRTRPAPSAEPATAGSTTFRQTVVFERTPGRAARKSIHGVRSTQSASTCVLASARADQRVESAERLRPFSASR